MTCKGCTRERPSPDGDPTGKLVSCIMPTHNRRRFVPMAIESFLAQTYEPKELIIIDDGDLIEDLIPQNHGIKIRRRGTRWIAKDGVPTDGTSKHTTGWKLNYALDTVTLGHIIAKWDDDDWHDPTYLERVVPHLKDYVAVGLQSCLFYDLAEQKTWTLTQGPRLPIDGTMVFWRSAWEKNRFRDVSQGEGHRFLKAIPRISRLGLDLAPALYVALRHGGNTTRWEPGPPMWQPSETDARGVKGFAEALARIG